MTAEFIIGTISDKRISVNKDLVNTTTSYFPESASLFARLAELQSIGQLSELAEAEKNIQRSINFSPNKYRYQLMLAEIRDSRNDPIGAETAFNEALRLAPQYSEVHWKFANFLIRQKKVEDSLEHFRIAAHTNPSLFPATLDLVWAVSDGNIPQLEKTVAGNQKGQLKLALLLAKQSRFSEAAESFLKVDKEVALPAWESSTIFDLMISKGFSKLANDLWLKLQNVSNDPVNSSTVWNGDFENMPDNEPAQFNWRIGKSDYARIGFDNSKSHSGNRSLLLDFLGRDTTKLDNEIKHLIVLRPGINYCLEFYFKTEELKTEEGPRVVINDKSNNLIAQSDSISSETNDWKKMVINFTAPPKVTGDAITLFISIKRQPRYVYDAPMRGRIWFDDFLMKEVNGK